MSKDIKVIGIVMAGWGKAGLIAELKKVEWGSKGGSVGDKNFSGIYFSLYCLANRSHKFCPLKLIITIKS